MSLCRRYLNLLVNEHIPGVKSLRFIDLKLQRLFYPGTPPRAPAPASEPLRLPRPSFTFRPGHSDDANEWRIHCFPLLGRKVICADQSGRGFFVDADACVAGNLPPLQRLKRMPFSISIPRPNLDVFANSDMIGSILFVLERFPEHGDRFEAYVYCFPSKLAREKVWCRYLLPPPPFVRQTRSRSQKKTDRTEITAYAVVGGGSHICVSVEGAAAGTYRMDTDSYKWTKVGEWTLPFHGKVEYVPELDLWFGFSADAKALAAAADLSGAMDSRPPLVEEFDGGAAPEACQDSQLVNLGSGRFCIARFFGAATAATDGDLGGGDELAGKSSVVLTGVEVVPHAPADGSSNGERKLQVIKHKSRRLNNIDDATVEAVF